MTPDAVLRMVERLPHVEPDATRTDRVRARCHAALARKHTQSARKPSATAHGWESAFVGGVCLVYLSQVVRQALHLYGIRF